MKRNLLYLAGIALFATGLFSSCEDNEPSYTNLTIETEALTINLDETAEGSFRITQGNGNYKVTSSNVEVVTAIVSGDEVKVTGLQYGSAILTVTDWAKQSSSVKVVVDQEQELTMKTSSTTMFVGESKTLEVYSGNGGYSITSSDESVATATISEDGKVNIAAIKPGAITLTVKDKRNKTAEITVKVIKKLIVDNSNAISYMTVGEPITIKVLDGNGGYTCSTDGSATYINCSMSTDGTEVTINGLKRYRLNKTVTIKDQAGQSIGITVINIDDPYMENPSYRYFVQGSSSYQSLSTSKVGLVSYAPEFNLSQLVIKTTGSFASGFSIQFEGDLSVGEKKNAVLYKVTKDVIDKSVKYSAEDCKIDKVEDGWYWVSFMEPNCAARSYFITKQ